jgi:transposase/IS5 family transposase
MRGDKEEQAAVMVFVAPDHKVPQDHPIRRIKPIVDRALKSLSPVFSEMYSKRGRPSIPPESLLKASILIALYSVRSERQFCERLEYDLLFKWFLDQDINTPAFDASTFSKNRQRLLDHDVARQFFQAVLAEARQRDLLSDDHFTVDGTLLEAWASLKSVQPRDRDDWPGGGFKNPDVDYRGQKRSNQTHVSRTDSQALLARKGPGKETRLSYAGHVLMENRNGLVVEWELTQATGYAEREAALVMLDRLPRQPGKRITLGADKGYDARGFVAELRQRRVTPHVAQNQSGRRSAIDGRSTSHSGYRVSQRIRKRVEEIFGWMKTVGGGRKLRYIGLAANQLWTGLTAAAHNLVRLARIEGQQAAAAA